MDREHGQPFVPAGLGLERLLGRPAGEAGIPLGGGEASIERALAALLSRGNTAVARNLIAWLADAELATPVEVPPMFQLRGDDTPASLVSVNSFDVGLGATQQSLVLAELTLQQLLGGRFAPSRRPVEAPPTVQWAVQGCGADVPSGRPARSLVPSEPRAERVERTRPSAAAASATTAAAAGLIERHRGGGGGGGVGPTEELRESATAAAPAGASAPHPHARHPRRGPVAGGDPGPDRRPASRRGAAASSSALAAAAAAAAAAPPSTAAGDAYGGAAPDTRSQVLPSLSELSWAASADPEFRSSLLQLVTDIACPNLHLSGSPALGHRLRRLLIARDRRALQQLSRAQELLASAAVIEACVAGRAAVDGDLCGRMLGTAADVGPRKQMLAYPSTLTNGGTAAAGPPLAPSLPSASLRRGEGHALGPMLESLESMLAAAAPLRRGGNHPAVDDAGNRLSASAEEFVETTVELGGSQLTALLDGVLGDGAAAPLLSLGLLTAPGSVVGLAQGIGDRGWGVGTAAPPPPQPDAPGSGAKTHAPPVEVSPAPPLLVERAVYQLTHGVPYVHTGRRPGEMVLARCNGSGSGAGVGPDDDLPPGVTMGDLVQAPVLRGRAVGMNGPSDPSAGAQCAEDPPHHHYQHHQQQQQEALAVPASASTPDDPSLDNAPRIMTAGPAPAHHQQLLALEADRTPGLRVTGLLCNSPVAAAGALRVHDVILGLELRYPAPSPGPAMEEEEEEGESGSAPMPGGRVVPLWPRSPGPSPALNGPAATWDVGALGAALRHAAKESRRHGAGCSVHLTLARPLLLVLLESVLRGLPVELCLSTPWPLATSGTVSGTPASASGTAAVPTSTEFIGVVAAATDTAAPAPETSSPPASEAAATSAVVAATAPAAEGLTDGPSARPPAAAAAAAAPNIHAPNGPLPPTPPTFFPGPELLRLTRGTDTLCSNSSCFGMGVEDGSFGAVFDPANGLYSGYSPCGAERADPLLEGPWTQRPPPPSEAAVVGLFAPDHRPVGAGTEGRKRVAGGAAGAAARRRKPRHGPSGPGELGAGDGSGAPAHEAPGHGAASASVADAPLPRAPRPSAAAAPQPPRSAPHHQASTAPTAPTAQVAREASRTHGAAEAEALLASAPASGSLDCTAAGAQRAAATGHNSAAAAAAVCSWLGIAIMGFSPATAARMPSAPDLSQLHAAVARGGYSSPTAQALLHRVARAAPTRADLLLAAIRSEWRYARSQAGTVAITLAETMSAAAAVAAVLGVPLGSDAPGGGAVGDLEVQGGAAGEGNAAAAVSPLANAAAPAASALGGAGPSALLLEELDGGGTGGDALGVQAAPDASTAPIVAASSPTAPIGGALRTSRRTAHTGPVKINLRQFQTQALRRLCEAAGLDTGGDKLSLAWKLRLVLRSEYGAMSVVPLGTGAPPHGTGASNAPWAWTQVVTRFTPATLPYRSASEPISDALFPPAPPSNSPVAASASSLWTVVLPEQHPAEEAVLLLLYPFPEVVATLAAGFKLGSVPPVAVSGAGSPMDVDPAAGGSGASGASPLGGAGDGGTPEGSDHPETNGPGAAAAPPVAAPIIQIPSWTAICGVSATSVRRYGAPAPGVGAGSPPAPAPWAPGEGGPAVATLSTAAGGVGTEGESGGADGAEPSLPGPPSGSPTASASPHAYGGPGVGGGRGRDRKPSARLLETVADAAAAAAMEARLPVPLPLRGGEKPKSTVPRKPRFGTGVQFPPHHLPFDGSGGSGGPMMMMMGGGVGAEDGAPGGGDPNDASAAAAAGGSSSSSLASALALGNTLGPGTPYPMPPFDPQQPHGLMPPPGAMGQYLQLQQQQFRQWQQQQHQAQTQQQQGGQPGPLGPPAPPLGAVLGAHNFPPHMLFSPGLPPGPPLPGPLLPRALPSPAATAAAAPPLPPGPAPSSSGGVLAPGVQQPFQQLVGVTVGPGVSGAGAVPPPHPSGAPGSGGAPGHGGARAAPLAPSPGAAPVAPSPGAEMDAAEAMAGLLSFSRGAGAPTPSAPSSAAPGSPAAVGAGVSPSAPATPPAPASAAVAPPPTPTPQAPPLAPWQPSLAQQQLQQQLQMQQIQLQQQILITQQQLQQVQRAGSWGTLQPNGPVMPPFTPQAQAFPPLGAVGAGPGAQAPLHPVGPGLPFPGAGSMGGFPQGGGGVGGPPGAPAPGSPFPPSAPGPGGDAGIMMGQQPYSGAPGPYGGSGSMGAYGAPSSSGPPQQQSALQQHMFTLQQQFPFLTHAQLHSQALQQQTQQALMQQHGRPVQGGRGVVPGPPAPLVRGRGRGSVRGGGAGSAGPPGVGQLPPDGTGLMVPYAGMLVQYPPRGRAPGGYRGARGSRGGARGGNVAAVAGGCVGMGLVGAPPGDYPPSFQQQQQAMGMAAPSPQGFGAPYPMPPPAPAVYGAAVVYGGPGFGADTQHQQQQRVVAAPPGPSGPSTGPMGRVPPAAADQSPATAAAPSSDTSSVHSASGPGEAPAAPVPTSAAGNSPLPPAGSASGPPPDGAPSAPKSRSRSANRPPVGSGRTSGGSGSGTGSKSRLPRRSTGSAHGPSSRKQRLQQGAVGGGLEHGVEDTDTLGAAPLFTSYAAAGAGDDDADDDDGDDDDDEEGMGAPHTGTHGSTAPHVDAAVAAAAAAAAGGAPAAPRRTQKKRIGDKRRSVSRGEGRVGTKAHAAAVAAAAGGRGTGASGAGREGLQLPLLIGSGSPGPLASAIHDWATLFGLPGPGGSGSSGGDPGDGWTGPAALLASPHLRWTYEAPAPGCPAAAGAAAQQQPRRSGAAPASGARKRALPPQVPHPSSLSSPPSEQRLQQGEQGAGMEEDRVSGAVALGAAGAAGSGVEHTSSPSKRRRIDDPQPPQTASSSSAAAAAAFPPAPAAEEVAGALAAPLCDPGDAPPCARTQASHALGAGAPMAVDDASVIMAVDAPLPPHPAEGAPSAGPHPSPSVASAPPPLPTAVGSPVVVEQPPRPCPLPPALAVLGALMASAVCLELGGPRPSSNSSLEAGDRGGGGSPPSPPLPLGSLPFIISARVPDPKSHVSRSVLDVLLGHPALGSDWSAASLHSRVMDPWAGIAEAEEKGGGDGAAPTATDEDGTATAADAAAVALVASSHESGEPGLTHHQQQQPLHPVPHHSAAGKGAVEARILASGGSAKTATVSVPRGKQHQQQERQLMQMLAPPAASHTSVAARKAAAAAAAAGAQLLLRQGVWLPGGSRVGSALVAAVGPLAPPQVQLLRVAARLGGLLKRFPRRSPAGARALLQSALGDREVMNGAVAGAPAPLSRSAGLVDRIVGEVTVAWLGLNSPSGPLAATTAPAARPSRVSRQQASLLDHDGGLAAAPPSPPFLLNSGGGALLPHLPLPPSAPVDPALTGPVPPPTGPVLLPVLALGDSDPLLCDMGPGLGAGLQRPHGPVVPVLPALGLLLPAPLPGPSPIGPLPGAADAPTGSTGCIHTLLQRVTPADLGRACAALPRLARYMDATRPYFTLYNSSRESVVLRGSNSADGDDGDGAPGAPLPQHSLTLVGALDAITLCVRDSAAAITSATAAGAGEGGPALVASQGEGGPPATNALGNGDTREHTSAVGRPLCGASAPLRRPQLSFDPPPRGRESDDDVDGSDPFRVVPALLAILSQRQGELAPLPTAAVAVGEPEAAALQRQRRPSSVPASVSPRGLAVIRRLGEAVEAEVTRRRLGALLLELTTRGYHSLALAVAGWVPPTLPACEGVVSALRRGYGPSGQGSEEHDDAAAVATATGGGGDPAPWLGPRVTDWPFPFPVLRRAPGGSSPVVPFSVLPHDSLAVSALLHSLQTYAVCGVLRTALGQGLRHPGAVVQYVVAAPLGGSLPPLRRSRVLGTLGGMAAAGQQPPRTLTLASGAAAATGPGVGGSDASTRSPALPPKSKSRNRLDREREEKRRRMTVPAAAAAPGAQPPTQRVWPSDEAGTSAAGAAPAETRGPVPVVAV